MTDPARSGARSMRTGIAIGGANVESYSPVEQTVTFGATVASAQLTFWRSNFYDDGAGECDAAWRRHGRGRPPSCRPRKRP